MSPKILNLVSLLPSILLGIAVVIISQPAASATLTGSGDLPFPGDTGQPNRINPIYADSPGSFTGTWDTTAALAWQGTFTGTPNRIATTTTTTGINTMNFSGLANGVLPENTFFILGDLDQGSISGEIISLRAWDTSNILITTPWLNEPTYQDGTNDPQLASMLPDFMWDSSTGTYTFDGNGETFQGNPSTVVFMPNNQEILILEVNDKTPFAGFGIAAPPLAVPEPTIVWLIIPGLTTLIFLKHRRKKGVSHYIVQYF